MLPGLMNHLPSYSFTSFLCVCPDIRMSTSNCRCITAKLWASPQGTIWWPWIRPILNWPICITLYSGNVVSSSKPPRTTWTLGARPLSSSYCSLVTKFPVQRTSMVVMKMLVKATNDWGAKEKISQLRVCSYGAFYLAPACAEISPEFQLLCEECGSLQQLVQVLRNQTLTEPL